MADETFRVTGENREIVLKLAIAIANLKDIDATIPVRRQEIEQKMAEQRQAFEQRAQVEREKKLDAVRAVEKDLIGDLGQGVFVTLNENGAEYTVHRPGPQLGPVPDKARGKTKGRGKAARGRKRAIAKPADPNQNGATKKKLAPVK